MFSRGNALQVKAFPDNSKIHIQLAFYHAVVELSALACFFSEEHFEFFMRRYDIALLAAALSENSAHLAVDILSLSQLEKSLTIGGITDNDRIFRLNEFGDIGLFYH